MLMKMKLFKDMTDAELDSKIAELRKEKFNTRAQAKSGQNENPAKMKGLRKDLARALTERKSEAPLRRTPDSTSTNRNIKKTDTEP